jgi:hypothetical protein
MAKYSQRMLSATTSPRSVHTQAAATALARDVVTREQLETFDADGVVKIPGAIDPAWIDPLLELASRQLASPSRWVTDSNRGASTARLFTDRYLWRDEPMVRRFVFESGVAGLAGRLLATREVRFYFDHLLVKQPGTAEPTPWHQDIPYWPLASTSSRATPSSSLLGRCTERAGTQATSGAWRYRPDGSATTLSGLLIRAATRPSGRRTSPSRRVTFQPTMTDFPCFACSEGSNGQAADLISCAGEAPKGPCELSVIRRG